MIGTSVSHESVEAWDDQNGGESPGNDFEEEIIVDNKTHLGIKKEEVVEDEAAEENGDVEKGKYPLPVGDVTCCFRKELINSPMDLLTLTFGWLVLNKTQILSGITVALAQVPEAVSFSFVAGVDPIVGLQSAWIMGICTSLGGGRPGMVAGATGAVAVVLTGLIRDHGLGHLFYCIMFAGIIQMAFGFLRLGVLVRMIPHPGEPRLSILNYFSIQKHIYQCGSLTLLLSLCQIQSNGWILQRSWYCHWSSSIQHLQRSRKRSPC